ncbi:MAG TPA: peptide ABC transporter substrate-binding protein [Rhabdochlamydiaceae bacterium]|jgi:oligopeptide transport system substrate-binding protein|nr:peptide ABC transporter substrate-binding protein [Rhabdochlamydiaceae bacterium]
MKIKRLKAFCAIGLLLMMALLAACQKTGVAGQKRKVLRTCIAADVPCLDPRKGTDMSTQGVVRMLFAGLVYLDQNLVPQLDLASSYHVSDDFKTYTFYLKKSYWSDGSAVTAEDFVETWKTALTPAYFSPNTNLFHFIKNGKKAYLGTLSIDQIGLQALDEKTLVIELEKPNKNFLNVLINSVFAPVHKSMRYDQSNYKHFVSCGPFQLKKYALKDQIILHKNPHYWNAPHVKLDELDYLIVKDPTTALLMFEKKEIDWLGEPFIKIPSDAVPNLRAQAVLHSVQGAGTHWLFFNTQKFPYNNVNIRKALALAIDRERIIKDVMHYENSSAPLGLIPKILKKEKWHPWFKDNDVALAKECFAKGMEELGLTPRDFPPLTINFATNAFWSSILQAIQQMWSENLGIRVNNAETDPAIFFHQYSHQEFDIARMGWLIQYDDLVNMLEIFKHKNIQPNFTGWENGEYIRHTEAIASSSESQRWEHIEAAEKIFFDEFPSIPIIETTALYLQQPYVKGVHLNYLFQIDFRWASVDP